MRVGVVILTHSVLPDRAIESLKTAEHDIDLHVFFHGDSDEVLQAVEALVADANGVLYPYRCNRGVARSWNEGIKACLDRGADAVLLLNDDCHFLSEDRFNSFIAFAEAAFEEPRWAVATTSGVEPYGGNLVQDQGFACILLPRKTIDRIGYFDQNFHKAYYEDFDYGRRILLAGQECARCPDVNVEHQRGLTRRANPSIQDDLLRAIEGNLAYYLRKWGGPDVGNVSFRLAFDRFDPRITWESHNAPFGSGFDRDDDTAGSA